MHLGRIGTQSHKVKVNTCTFIHSKRTQRLHPLTVADEQQLLSEQRRASGHSKQALHTWINVV